MPIPPQPPEEVERPDRSHEHSVLLFRLSVPSTSHVAVGAQTKHVGICNASRPTRTAKRTTAESDMRAGRSQVSGRRVFADPKRELALTAPGFHRYPRQPRLWSQIFEASKLTFWLSE
jgi:hypothetical protein